MNERTNPEFSDILKLVESLPRTPGFNEGNYPSTIAALTAWLDMFEPVYDMSRGFLINRCALYWAGYDRPGDFDGAAFVQSCQDAKGPLHRLAQLLDTDLQIFELDPQNPDRPDSSALALAASYGMMAIEEPTQMFATCSIGRGVNEAAQDALTALEADKKFPDFDLESFMARHCGLDHAAILGAGLAGMLKGIPVIMEGPSGRLVKKIIERMTGRAAPVIAAADLPDARDIPQGPGRVVISTAILLKTLHTGRA